MIKALFLFLIFTKFSFACSLCATFTPYTLVNLELENSKEKIEKVLIRWKTTKEFTNELKKVYDVNSNLKLDENELKTITKVLTNYISYKNYLLHLSYDKLVNKEISKKVEAKNIKAYIENEIIHFSYEIPLNYDVIEGNILYIKVEDEKKYFVMYMSNEIKFNKFDDLKVLVGDKSVFFYFGLTPNEDDLNDEYTNPELKANYEDRKPTINDEIQTSNKEIEKSENSINDKYIIYLKEFTQKVKDYLLKIKDGDNIALFSLLFISFIYGVIHAIGPGHGKSLAFSYFMSNKSSYIKAFLISQASAFIHIIGALVLVSLALFIIDTFLNSFVQNSVVILTKVSAIMIIFLALFLLYNKLKNRSCSCNSCCSSENKSSTIKWSISKNDSKPFQKLKPSFVKKDLFFVITAGLIPCPGTVLLFVYAFVLKTYLAVFLAAIFISLGMGFVIFVSSFLGLSFHKFSEKSHKLTNFLEVLAPIIMFILGIFLFFGAEII